MSLELLAASMCGFVLLGVVDLLLFIAIDCFQPGAFAGVPAGLSSVQALNCFSFSTLLAVGFGHKVPLPSVARKATVLLGLAGHCYDVFVVGVVVGKCLSGSVEATPAEAPRPARRRNPRPGRSFAARFCQPFPSSAVPRIKLQRFAQNALRPDIVEPGKPTFGQLAGCWRAEFFGNDHPLVLEVGCGKGEYTVGLAQRHPAQNFLGLDIKGERIWRGSTQAAALGLRNVGFLRLLAHQLGEHFAPGELSEIWITFPDPRPRDRDIKRRLTAPRFLDLYQPLLAPGAPAQLKTDSEGLFEYTLEVLAGRPGAVVEVATRDLYAETDPAFAAAQAIQTHFESKYRALGVPIKYVRFRLS